MKNLKQLLKRLFCKAHVSKSLPDHYAGELNTKRIKAYKMLAEQYIVDESTVRDCFCKGADWYKEQVEGNVCQLLNWRTNAIALIKKIKNGTGTTPRHNNQENTENYY